MDVYCNFIITFIIIIISAVEILNFIFADRAS
jgi:hypothetical protein